MTWRIQRVVLIVLAASLLIAAPANAESKASTPSSGDDAMAQAKNFFARGVYWPNEAMSAAGKRGSAKRRKQLPKLIRERLDDLQSHHVNLIWTVNGPDRDELKMLCRMASDRDIKVVATSWRWAMNGHGDNSDTRIKRGAKRIKRYWKSVKPSLRPLAFGLSDEPRGSAIDAVAKEARPLLKAGIPVTTVIMWSQIKKIMPRFSQFPIVCQDDYPFFNSPFGPRGNASFKWYISKSKQMIQVCDKHDVAPWIMPQAYQEVWGPTTRGAGDQVVALPGSGIHWRMPTPAEIRWQTWTAVGLGAKGVVFFKYFGHMPNRSRKKADKVTKEWRVTKPTPTGGFFGLVSHAPDYTPSPQYEAMSHTYARLEKLAPLLLTLTNDELWEPASIPHSVAGDVVNTLTNPKDKKQRYLVVVASSKRKRGEGVRLKVDPAVKGLTPIGDAPKPFARGRRVQLNLQPGEGGLWRISQ